MHTIFGLFTSVHHQSAKWVREPYAMRDYRWTRITEGSFYQLPRCFKGNFSGSISSRSRLLETFRLFPVRKLLLNLCNPARPKLKWTVSDHLNGANLHWVPLDRVLVQFIEWPVKKYQVHINRRSPESWVPEKLMTTTRQCPVDCKRRPDGYYPLQRETSSSSLGKKISFSQTNSKIARK